MVDMSSPKQVSVIALGLAQVPGEVASEQAGARERELMAALASALAQQATIQIAGRSGEAPEVSVIVPSEASAGVVLRRLTTLLAGFDASHPGVQPRYVAHCGILFETRHADRTAYMGSALRSAHSTLRRLPLTVSAAATRDFAQFVATWDRAPLRFTPLTGTAASDGLQGIVMEQQDDGGDWLKTAFASSVSTADDAFRQYLYQRLADELGPFARVLVDTALRANASVSDAVLDVSREIEKLDARVAFQTDCEKYLRERSGLG